MVTKTVSSINGTSMAHWLKTILRKLEQERLRNDRLKSFVRRVIVSKKETLKRCKLECNALRRKFVSYRKFKNWELQRLNEQYLALSHEYHQVMSERDTVNKNMEALEEKIMKIEEINSQIMQQSQSNNSSCKAIFER